MFKTALLGLFPFTSDFDRFVSFFERLLDLNGAIAARNSEPPYFGL
jgi:hypothetical protein